MLLFVACSESGLIATNPDSIKDKDTEVSTEIKIDSVSPRSGYRNETTSVIISGSGFGEDESLVTVRFGMKEAVVNWVSDDEIECDAPIASDAGAVDVTVEVEGKGSKKKSNGFFYLDSETDPAIEITEFSPDFAGLDETVTVVIEGSGFGEDESEVSVYFGDKSDSNKAEILSVSDEEIECEAPAMSTAQSVKVTVVVGDDSAVSSTSFSYRDSASVYIDSNGITPNYGPTDGGNQVVIKGGNFTSDVTITFNGEEADCSFDSSTQLTCTAPEQNSAGSVTLTANDDSTGKSYPAASGYTYYNAPEITSVSNDFVSSTSDDYNVTISGSNFEAGTMEATVTIDGVKPSNCNVSASSIACFDVSGTADATYNVVVELAGIGSDSGEDDWSSRQETEDPEGTLTFSGSSSISVEEGTSECVEMKLTASRSVSESTEIEISHNGVGDIHSNSSCTNGTNYVTIASGQTSGKFYYLAEDNAETVKFNTSIASSDGDLNFSDATTYTLTITVPSTGGGDGDPDACSSSQVEIDGKCYTKQTMNITSYCSATYGSSYYGSFNTTYNAWECKSGSQSYSISMYSVCSYQLDGSLYARAANTKSPSSTDNKYSWFCYEADSSVEGTSHPTITSLSTSSAAVSGGDSLTVYGKNLSSTGIYFNNAKLSCSSISATEATCTTSASVPRYVNIVAATDSLYSNAYSFTYSNPWITSLSPTSGTQSGGTVVSIVGKNFGSDSSKIRVTINDLNATNISVSSPDSWGKRTITATTPSSSNAAAYKIKVLVKGSDSSEYSGTGPEFTYTATSTPPTISSVSPTYLSADGGISITITGSNLSGATVTIGGVAATVTSSSSSKITLTSVKGTGGSAYSMKVSNSSGSASQYLYYKKPPQITGLDISSGVTRGDRKMKILGSNLMVNHVVYMNGSEITSKCDRISESEIECTTPSYGTCLGGSVDVQVKNIYGSDKIESNKMSYTYSNIPTITNITKKGMSTSVDKLTEEVEYDFHGTNFNDIGSGTNPSNDVVVKFEKGSSSYTTDGCSVNNKGTKLTCKIKDTKATSNNDWSGVSVYIKNKFSTNGCSEQKSSVYSSTVTIKGN